MHSPLEHRSVRWAMVVIALLPVVMIAVMLVAL